MDSERSTPSKKDEHPAQDIEQQYEDPFMLRPEQRMVMRSVPFFVLPTYENTPKTSHIKPKVDTHNPSYAPRSNSATQIRVSSNKTDYSHIKARVDAGRPTSSSKGVPTTSTPKRKGSGDELQHSRVNNLRRDCRRPRSAGSLQHPQRNFQFTATTQFPPAVRKLPYSERKYKNISSKIGSLDKIHHRPGGGTAAIKKGSPDSAARPIAQKERNPVKVAKSKVTKPSIKGKVKSRIDQSDPNPAHKLSHSLEELTIPEGQTLNPRFQARKGLPQLSCSIQKSRTFESISQLLKEEEADSSISDSQAALPRSATFEFLSRIEPLEDPETQSDSTLSQSVGNSEAMSTVVVTQNYVAPCNGVSKRELYFEDDSINHQENSSTINSSTMSTHSDRHNRVPIVQPELDSTPNEEQVQTAFTTDLPAELEQEASNTSDERSEDLDIYDIEVSNSASETTVVLKHLLALSGKSSSNSTSMPIIEESESEEEEEEEDYPKVELGPYTLAHPVPQLLISDEDGSIVDTISIGVNLCTIADSDTQTGGTTAPAHGPIGTSETNYDAVEPITHL